jgi:hypothetical protein
MYGSWRELVDGYTKSLWTLPLPTVALLALLYVVPPWPRLRGSRAGRWPTPPGSPARS